MSLVKAAYTHISHAHITRTHHTHTSHTHAYSHREVTMVPILHHQYWMKISHIWYTCAHTHKHTYTCAHILMHTHTQTCMQMSSCTGPQAQQPATVVPTSEDIRQLSAALELAGGPPSQQLKNFASFLQSSATGAANLLHFWLEAHRFKVVPNLWVVSKWNS